jgi:predicted site-specific integrase-resolvase
MTEAGSRLGVTQTTIKRWINRDILLAQWMPSGVWKVRESTVDRLLEVLETNRARKNQNGG